tara:strand:- start:735 stop:1382 length:648 start_codon:yes stop_codon:yes gene_type:complete
MSEEKISPEGSFKNQESASGISFFAVTPLKVVVMVGIIVGGCILILALSGAFSSEAVAQVDSPQKYDGGGVIFKYPGNWSITEDGGKVSEGEVRYLFLETAGDNFVSIQIFRATEASELSEYTQINSRLLAEEISLGSYGASTFSGMKEKDGIEVIEEHLEMTVYGESIPYKRVYCRKRIGDTIAFIILQVTTEEYEMVIGGFDQILESISYEGP